MNKEKRFWGLLFILGGIFLIVNKLGYFSNINVIGLLLTIFLVVILVKSLFRFNFAGILFPLAFISIIYDDQLEITAITPWTVLVAALLGSIGLSILFPKRHKHKYNWNNTYTEKIDVNDDSIFRHGTSFGSTIKYVNTDHLVEAEFTCSFGGMKVFFDNAKMENDSAIVHLNASFSGVELYIPKTWHIEDRTNISFGGIEEKNKRNIETTHTLILAGDISFSGVEITYI